MGENRIMHDLYEENQRLKARIEELEKKHWNECAQIAQYSDELNEVNSYTEIVEDMATNQTISGMNKSNELKEAKRLLKLAVEDLSCGGENNKCTKSCNTCTHSAIKGYGCRYFGEYHWRYADEALALIGGSENA